MFMQPSCSRRHIEDVADRRILTCPRDVLDHLRQGDMLAYAQAGGWRLVRADRLVAEDAVETLKRGGKLAPRGDCLPGFGKQMSQTWRWAKARRRAVPA